MEVQASYGLETGESKQAAVVVETEEAAVGVDKGEGGELIYGSWRGQDGDRGPGDAAPPPRRCLGIRREDGVGTMVYDGRAVPVSTVPMGHCSRRGNRLRQHFLPSPSPRLRSPPQLCRRPPHRLDLVALRPARQPLCEWGQAGVRPTGQRQAKNRAASPHLRSPRRRPKIASLPVPSSQPGALSCVRVQAALRPTRQQQSQGCMVRALIGSGARHAGVRNRLWGRDMQGSGIASGGATCRGGWPPLPNPSAHH